ncbi:MAG TPA: hypothetical protein PKD52_12190 [Clostridiales bacterium]|nr:hypothetical protein [Clostridiales bacterium]
MPSKHIYPPFMDKDSILCSRCFGPLAAIEQYGSGDKGYWFIAPCKQCGAKIKWYRDNNGETRADGDAENEENAFGFYMEGDEIVMKAK